MSAHLMINLTKFVFLVNLLIISQMRRTNLPNNLVSPIPVSRQGQLGWAALPELLQAVQECASRGHAVVEALRFRQGINPDQERVRSAEVLDALPQCCGRPRSIQEPHAYFCPNNLLFSCHSADGLYWCCCDRIAQLFPFGLTHPHGHWQQPDVECYKGLAPLPPSFLCQIHYGQLAAYLRIYSCIVRIPTYASIQAT